MSRKAAPRRVRPARPRDAKRAAAETMPGWIVPVVYAFVLVVLFREFFFAGGVLLGRDSYALSYFARDFYTDVVREVGRFPLWQPYLYGGLPFVEGMHGDIFYPPSLALFFLDARPMWGVKMVLHYFLAGILTYLWLHRGIGLRRGPAFFGGLVYMMGADLVSLVFPGGDGKLFVSALAPLMFWLTERAMRHRGVSDFAFFALGLAAVMFTSHMQLAYFTVWGVSLYFLFRLVQVWRAEKRPGTAIRLLASFMLAGVLGVGASAVQFFPPLGYLREWSHRVDRTLQADATVGYAWSTSYSLHWEEAVSLVVPEFIGDHVQTETRSGATYWGRNPIKFNHEYAGLVPLLLIPVLLLRRRDALAVFFMGLGGFSLLYALGANTPLFRLFYLVPGVNLFRAPSLIIFLYGLSVATLAALGLQRLLDWSRQGGEEVASARRTLWITTAIFGVLALLASAGAVMAVWEATIGVAPGREVALQNNLDNIRAGFWITFFIAAAVAGIWELMARELLAWRGALIAFSLVAAADLYRVDRPFIRGTVLLERREDPVLFAPDESIRYLQGMQAAGEVFRVWDPFHAYGTNVLASHRLEQLAGHHGNEIGRYRALVGGDDAPNVAANPQLMDLLNVRYLVAPERLQGAGMEEVFVGSRSAVYRNPNALPRAFLVGNVEVVPDAAASARLSAPDFDPRAIALLPEPLPPSIPLEPGPQGRVEWIERDTHEFTLNVTTDRPALLVVTDNYYPAWRAEVDGVAAPLLRANFAFRAVPINAGEHTVRFYYDRGVLQTSAVASIVLLSLLLAVGLLGVVRDYRGTGRQA